MFIQVLDLIMSHICGIKFQNLNIDIMAKGKDSKKNVKKEPAKTKKEKKEEKRLKKPK